MKFIEYSKKLDVIKEMAGHKRTGNLQELAHKLEVSERTTARMVEQLRDSGIPIVYNRRRGTYEIRSQ